MIVRSGYLRVESLRGTNVPSTLGGHYDLGLFAASWDRRCLSVLEADALTIDHSAVLCFATHDEFGHQKSNEAALCDYLAGIGSAVHRIENVTEDVAREWGKVWSTIAQLASEQKPRRCL